MLLICSVLHHLPIRNLPMSSTPFETDLRADRRLRCLLMVLASGLHLAGAVLLLNMRLPAGVHVLLLTAWVCMCARDWRYQLRAYRRVTAIRIQDSGHIETVGPGGLVEPVRLLGGSVVLPQIAWLRLAFADRSCYGELLAGDACRSTAWHRLQLGWRQHGARFGQPDRS